jgi:hypothetical protein
MVTKPAAVGLGEITGFAVNVSNVVKSGRSQRALL